MNDPENFGVRFAQWMIEAKAKPSGQPCNGIHDATSDRRVILLLDLLETTDKELLSSRERLAETEDELVRLGSFMYEANEKLAAVGEVCALVEADDRESLNTYGQHLTGAPVVVAEMIRAAITEAGTDR